MRYSTAALETKHPVVCFTALLKTGNSLVKVDLYILVSKSGCAVVYVCVCTCKFLWDSLRVGNTNLYD